MGTSLIVINNNNDNNHDNNNKKNKNFFTFTEKEYNHARYVQENVTGVITPKRFMLLSGGLYEVHLIEPKDDKPFYSLERICGYLYIKANIHDVDFNNWGFLVVFYDLANQRQEIIIRRDTFIGKIPVGTDCVSLLSKRGLYVRNENSLIDFFKMSGTIRIKTEVTQTGWYDKCFGLPGLTIGENNDIYFNINTKSSGGYMSAGTIFTWQEQISKYCEKNPRLLFAVSCAFAAPLLRICGLEGGGFHFYGQSSCGKTTLLRVATSVCGSPDYMQNWRATSNGLESVAESHNDLLLVLDEIGQADSSAIGDTVYMLANGLGKVRSTAKGTPKNVKKWLNLFLSTGELDLESHMRTSHKTSKDGQEVRCLSIQATSETSNYGIFDNIYNFANSADFADYLISKTKKCYGTPLWAFLEQIVPHPLKTEHEFEKYLAEQKAYFGNEIDGLANRALKRFALVGFAGEKATELELTGWEKGSATNAFRQLFNEWKNNPDRMSELDKLKQQVRLFLEKDREYGVNPYYNQCDIRGTEQWVSPARFKTEVVRGFNKSWALNELIKCGWIEPGHARDRKTQKRCYTKDGVWNWVYVFNILTIFKSHWAHLDKMHDENV